MDVAVEVTAKEGENEVKSPIAQHLCQYLLSTISIVEPYQRKKGVGKIH